MRHDTWSIDMNPARTYIVRIEADFEKINDLLANAVGREIDAYDFPPTACCDSSREELDNKLHLYKVYTIASDLTESDPVFVMARSKEGAACLFHKARARDCENTICEVIVSKLQDAEVCDPS
jgi:hypothetical protein